MDGGVKKKYINVERAREKGGERERKRERERERERERGGGGGDREKDRQIEEEYNVKEGETHW